MQIFTNARKKKQCLIIFISVIPDDQTDSHLQKCSDNVIGNSPDKVKEYIHSLEFL